MMIHRQIAKVTLEVTALAVYTSRHPHIQLRTDTCAQFLLNHPVKYDFWNVTTASVFLIINRDEPNGVFSVPLAKVMGLFAVEEA